MPGWRDLPQLLGPRLQEAHKRTRRFDLWLDNDIYLCILVFQHGMLSLRFTLFEAPDGTVLRLPMAEAARQAVGGGGYRQTVVVGNPRLMKGNMEQARIGLEQVKSELAAKDGVMYLYAAVRPDGLEAGTPGWKASAQFEVVGDFLGPFRPWDYSGVARNILDSIDDVKRFLLDSIAQAPTPALQPT
jgi:hypothetical protein